MATIQRRKGKRGTTYRAIIRMRGVVESKTFKRLDWAKRWAAKMETEIEEGKHFTTAEARKHTLDELVDRYIEQVVPSKRSGKDQARILRWWADQIGEKTLAEVTPALIVEHRDRLASEKTIRGTKRGAGTVNRYLAYISHAFTVAVREWQWIESNPLRRVSKLKEPRGRVRFLSDDERMRLLAACRESTEPRLYPLVVLAISTGARRGELLNLRWPDVDLRRGVAVIHQTKNDDRRALPLTGLALSVLRDLKTVRRLDTDLVFANSTGRAKFPRKAWEEALEAAEIQDYRWHDNRHSCASYLAMNGATLAEIAEVLGHRTLSMVARYSHLSEAHTSKVVARMNEAIFGAER